MLPVSQREHLSSLRYVMVGAAPVGRALEERWAARAGGEAGGRDYPRGSSEGRLRDDRIFADDIDVKVSKLKNRF